MVQIQSSLIKQIKIGRPEHSLIPHPLLPVTSHFYLNTPNPPQGGRQMCTTPNQIE